VKLNRFKSEVKVQIFLTILLLFLLDNFSFAAKQYPVEANILWERNIFYVSPVDFNGDSIDELVVILTDMVVQPENQNLQSLVATRFLDLGTFDNNSICGGLDSTNLWVTYIRRDSLFLYDLWPRREIFVAFGKDLAPPKGWNGYAQQVELSDINADGRLEAVVVIRGGYDLKPRGVFALDWKTGKLLWKFLCGPNPIQILLKDIDRDGKTEILCATHAVGNGNIANGTDDFHTYVFLLNSDGNVRWSKSIGVYSSFNELSWLYDRQSNSYKIFVCEVGSPAGDRKHDSIFVLDALSGQVLIRNQYGEFNYGHAIVHNAKRQELIAIAGSDDTLRLLNDKLNLMRKRAVNGNGCRNIISANFAGSGREEIAVQTNNGYNLLYDLNLKLLEKFHTGVVEEIRPIKNKEKSRLLLEAFIEGKRNWRLMEFNKISILSRGIPVGAVIAISLALIFIFGITLVYTRYRQTRDIRTVIRRLTGQAGVIELNRKGEIVNSNSKAREIISMLNGNQDRLPTTGPLAMIAESAKTMAKELETATVQETVISISPEQTYLVRCVPIRKGALLTFEDISAVEYLKRVTTWAPVAQKLAHGIKNPLATILGAVEQMDIKCEKEEGVKKYIGLVKEEVVKLKKMSDAFMKFTKLSPPVLHNKNINEFIKNIMIRYEPFTLTSPTGGEGVKKGKIKVEYEFDENLPLVPIDEEGITNVLNIVIENGIEAMSPSPSSSPIKGEGKKDDGVLKIKTATMEKFEKEAEKIKKYLIIEIADTGVGIQEKYLNKVFDPYFTYNKPFGTGLGLTLAKKIVESHNGFIEITSKEGIGTSVNLYLPLNKNA
jgi:signal transduction histidine kinase